MLDILQNGFINLHLAKCLFVILYVILYLELYIFYQTKCRGQCTMELASREKICNYLKGKCNTCCSNMPAEIYRSSFHVSQKCTYTIMTGSRSPTLSCQTHSTRIWERMPSPNMRLLTGVSIISSIGGAAHGNWGQTGGAQHQLVTAGASYVSRSITIMSWWRS